MNSEPAARDLLAAMPAVTEDQLRALRDRLADRADADGVLDVAYRTIDTPVGTLLGDRGGAGPGRLRHRKPRQRPNDSRR
jgi:methylated-DNA-[protein]-cysteine S-methyltransferase